MASIDTDVMRMVRRNKLVGMWAAKKLALVGEEAKAYSDELGRAAVDVRRNDILATLRKDFLAAGVAQSDEDILAVMNQSWLAAGKPANGRDATDGAALQIARNLMR
ncbi:ATPase inhibitor subunit zeta [Rhizobium sp. BK376]|uniref:ATPase inhibitor subunit zeta n=1 Tax=Rhizobium sp. BK376 TaxID=2512149 RepID=UPI0010510ADF|nr:ATPase inhibitor subunit zeta [Rhizobium sp. BK376]TCR75631.1 uncharacterized protein DUF1476 [Rhizobium sp. BK376]